MLVLQNANVYAPEALGKKDILIEGERIVRVADTISEFDAIDSIEKINLHGQTLVPGYIDLHEHITGGGGEGGPTTRVPEAQLSQIVSAGITTVVGLLGTDGISRSLENLLAKAQSFQQLGITCFMLSGSYGYPAVSLTDSVEKDIQLIDSIIGVKTAMSDHRSSNLNAQQLIALATSARRGGLLANKAGYTTIHMGDGKAKLSPLFEALDLSDVPISKFLPTHMSRNKELLEDGIAFIRRGGTIDITAGENKTGRQEVSRAIAHVLAETGNQNVTLSTDAYGSQPKFNEAGELIGLTYTTPITLHQQLLSLMRDNGFSLEKVLPLVTSNPARVITQPTKGRIAEGMDADLVVYDHDGNIDTVISRGTFAMKNKKVLMKGPFEQ